MFNNRLWAYKCYVVLLTVCILRQKCILGAEDFSTEEDDLESDEIVFQDEEEEVTTTIAPEVKTQVSKADFFLENDNFPEDSQPVSTTKEQRSRTNDSPVYPDPLGNYDTKAEIQNLDNKIKQSLESLRHFDEEQDKAKEIDNSPVSNFGDDDDEQGQRFKDWIAHQKNMAYTAYERHRSHHENYKPYKEHKVPKAYSKYKKYDHQRTRPTYETHQPPYYQGQLNYYGTNTDTSSSGYNSYHSPTKLRSHRLHHNHEPHPHHHHHHHHHHSHHRYVHGMNDYNRDRKWPHLTRVQYQLYEDKDRDTDLPPYIRKYNRRNKQLLDLLEGTMPPPTPPQKSSENMVANKRRQRMHHRYHSRRNPKRIIEDLFEEQRANPNNPHKNEDDQYMNDSASSVVYSSLATVIPPKSNAPLPAPSSPDSSSSSLSDSSVSSKTMSSSLSSSEGSYGASSSSDTLSSSTGLAGSNKDSDSEELKLIQKNELPGDHVDISSDEEDTSTADFGGTKSNSPQILVHHQSPSSAHSVSSVVTPHDELKVSPKANIFIYHRVPSPRVVGVGGTGGINGSKKQRLPFVAITDRRLEPSKTRQKDNIEQNHLPLP